jgi:hypothetical protein
LSDLNERADASKLLANWIGERIDNLKLPHNPKFHVPAICFHVALTHHTGIVTLIEQGRMVSGLALLRPLMESYLRGAWVYHVADKQAVDRFVRGKTDLKTHEIIADLERVEAFDQKRLSAIKREVWSDLCDYTHCGNKTIFAHYAGGEIRPNYDEEWLGRALLSADSWALLSGLALVLVASRIDLADEFLAKSLSFAHTPTV